MVSLYEYVAGWQGELTRAAAALACPQRFRNLAAPPSPPLPTASPAAEHPDDPLRNLYIQRAPPAGILFRSETRRVTFTPPLRVKLAHNRVGANPHSQ